jgi:putative oxidoreductase
MSVLSSPAASGPLALAHRIGAQIDALAAPVLTTSARLVFGGVLLVYFWASGMTKLGDGLLGFVKPDLGAYAQIFPRAMEAASYNVAELGIFHWAVVVAGTWAEFILPALVVLGLLTRLAALGMIGFIVVQSLTDIVGHNADPTTIGAWFDRASGSLILDQRAFWVLGLMILVFKGAGPLSLDRILFRNAP